MQIVKNPWLQQFYDGVVHTIYDYSKKPPVLLPDWKQKWLLAGGAPDQSYACTPDPLMATHPVDEHFLFNGSRMYLAAWEVFLPDVLMKVFGKRVPPCPCCGSALRVSKNGWAEFPRRILDVDTFHFVLARQYKCTECPGADR